MFKFFISIFVLATIASASSVPKQDELCQICKFALTAAQQFIENNATETEVIQALESEVCSKLGQFQQECVQLVSTVGPEVYELLSNKIDPETICKKIGLCTNAQVEKKNALPTCQVCQLILTAAQDFLEKNHTEAEVLEKINQDVCTKLGSLSQACTTYVNQFGPIVIDQLIKKIDPATICKDLTLCTSASTPKQFNWKDEECQLCTVVLSFAQQFAERNATDAQIIEFIDSQLCTKLSSFSQQCTTYVNTYGYLILQQLAQKIKPEAICEKLNLCKKAQKIIEARQVKSETCQLCTVVLTFAQQYLENNHTEEEVIDFIDNELCGKLGALASTCKTYVDAYGKVIIYQLAQKIDPSIVCKSLGLCSTSNSVLNINIVPKQVEQPKSETCQLCTLVLTFAQQYLENNATEEQVISFIDNQLCSKLGALSQVCTTYVNAYGPLIVYKLAQKIDPSIICHDFGLCVSNSEATFMKPININEPDHCKTCVLAAQELQTLLANPDVQKNIIGQINHQICENLGERANECVQLVNTYGPYFLKNLPSLINPEQLCKIVRACPSSVSFPTVTVEQPLVQNIGNTSSCILCKITVTTFVTQLKDPKVEQEIVNKLQGECNLLPPPFPTACSAILAAYGAEAIKDLANKINATTLCTDLKECP